MVKLLPVVWLPHDTGILTVLKPCFFTASIIAFVVFGLPHDVSLFRLFPPPVASSVLPRFQPVPIWAVICFAVLPVTAAAEALGVAHTISIAAASTVINAATTEKVFFVIAIFFLASEL